jgi:YD repeat-containing protein
MTQLSNGIRTMLKVLVMAAGLASAETVRYTYDDAGRLVRVDYGSGKSIIYTYDPAGNLLARTVIAGEPGANGRPHKPSPARKQPGK